MQSILKISAAFVLAATAVVAIPAGTTAAGTTVAVTSAAATTAAGTTIAVTSAAATTAAGTTVVVTSAAATTVAVTSVAATTSALPLPPVFTQVFTNLTAATQAVDFITFDLVSSVAECTAACNSVTGCNFFNRTPLLFSFPSPLTPRSIPRRPRKGKQPLLTCSLYSTCHTAVDATNTGGQTQPDGTEDFIANSSGFCKVA
ncbi:hypothetical protein BD779DRAFT_1471734 [Infundibulicybe gibba]|nr:hypothetical protein BD779DRAFT_1471734 [Infundibulicybe gibba]